MILFPEMKMESANRFFEFLVKIRKRISLKFGQMAKDLVRIALTLEKNSQSFWGIVGLIRSDVYTEPKRLVQKNSEMIDSFR